MKEKQIKEDIDDAIVFLRWGKQNLKQKVYSLYTYKQISMVTGKSTTYCRNLAS